MKKLLLLIGVSLFTLSFAQSTNEFALGQEFLKGLKILPKEVIIKETKGMIQTNPFRTTDKEIIQRITENKPDTKNVESLYAEFYFEGDHHDAGIYVFEFNSPDRIEKALNEISQQDNFRLFTKGNYLVEVWVDYGKLRNEIINKVSNHYVNDLKMKSVVGLKVETNVEVVVDAAVDGIGGVSEASASVVYAGDGIEEGAVAVDDGDYEIVEEEEEVEVETIETANVQ